MIQSLGISSSQTSAELFFTFSSKIKKALALSVFLCSFSEYIQAASAAPPANALPINGQVVAGSASISQTQTANAATMNVNQSSQRAVINWDSFNVGKNAVVNFNQPNSSAVTLNRVTGATQSLIDGAVRANGQVIFVNPNGVTFGKGAEVNAAAVVASTLNMADQEFMDGKSSFKDDGTGLGNKAGKIVNKGTIQTNNANGEGGFIALLAPEVRNQGYLIAQKGGTVAIGSGNQITLTIQGQSLIAIKVDESAYNGLISNKHIIEAPGGLVVLATGAANQLMAGVIKNTGRISANSAVNNGGVIELVASKITQAGIVNTNSQTSNGGQVNLVGNQITLAKSSSTTATGATAGGQVNVGLANTQVSGGTQVNMPTQAGIKANADQAAKNNQLAQTVTIRENALIDTSATQAGNGGAIAIWSQVQTTVAGILKSMGGLLSGNGGFIETSSKGLVSIAPTVNINTSANNSTGKAGTWLLDPVDLLIDASTANAISTALSTGNVTIAVTANTVTANAATVTANNCLGTCILNGSMNIDSGAHILKAGTANTTLTLSVAGNFYLNGSIEGQNLDVIISSSIAYLNAGSSINASKIMIQAQTINVASVSRILANYYSSGSGAGTLGNTIELLAQAIYVSGTLRLSGGLPTIPAAPLSAVGLSTLNVDQALNKIFSNDPPTLAVTANNNIINLIASTGTLNLQGGIVDATSSSGSINALVTAAASFTADNHFGAALGGSSFDLSNALFITENTVSAASGSLSLGYEIRNYAGSLVTLGAGSYANLSITGTPSYYSGVSTITNAVGAGTYSNLFVKGVSLSGIDSGRFMLVAIPMNLTVTAAQSTAAPVVTIVTAVQAAAPVPPPPPPPVVFSPPLPAPAPAKLEIALALAPMVAPAPPVAANSPPPVAGGEAPIPISARPQPLVALADGTIQLTPVVPSTNPPGSPPPVTAANPPANQSAPPAAAAPPPASRASANRDVANNNPEARRPGVARDGVEKSDTNDRTAKSTNGPSKYVSKYANGFKNSDKPAPKEGTTKTVATNKPSSNREGKYDSRVKAMNNNSAAVVAMRQNPFAGSISAFPPGVPHSDVTPIVLRGGDSLAQSYDDVPSIRNSGVANVGKSRNSENFHESLESVNLMSTLNLFIIH